MMVEHWSVLAARWYGDESLADAIWAEVDAIFADPDEDDDEEDA